MTEYISAHAHTWVAHGIRKGTTKGEEVILTDQMESAENNRDAMEYVSVFILYENRWGFSGYRRKLTGRNVVKWRRGVGKGDK